MSSTTDTTAAAGARPQIVGPDAGPEAPFPLRMEGKVISGFGRGSKELGIPTANLPVDASLTPWIADAKSGVYFGYAALNLPASHPNAHDGDNITFPSASSSSSPSSSSSSPRSSSAFAVFPMVMSIGYNPFYKNTVRSAEVHVLHRFAADFYDSHMRLLLLGFVREERDYASLEALVDDINLDCRVARASLDRDAWRPAGASPEGAEWLVKPL
ncbi:Riboflavin kinase [Purpureocillium takamizusanense]|uniref:Riboflavin kinase n=1 Tax=Purpureocillium takamizusanense TaxID=2060973 RepID=A0A9Q8VER2_9HYPO|nr:Riboflavin kinase [Purpureocillium takamizusanense]UNI22581.1 Riboflavin kinase [Purpureocillium takamizusanense]